MIPSLTELADLPRHRSGRFIASPYTLPAVWPKSGPHYANLRVFLPVRAGNFSDVYGRRSLYSEVCRSGSIPRARHFRPSSVGARAGHWRVSDGSDRGCHKRGYRNACFLGRHLLADGLHRPAIRRVEEAYRQPDLFIEPPKKAEQEAFDV